MRTRAFVGALGMMFALWVATPAKAGNIALTGHDDDYHCYYDGVHGSGIGDDACQQLKQLVTIAKNGSALPVLVFNSSDSGIDKIGADLTALGISYTEINPDTASNITDSLFNTSTYSAMLVASDQSCGGCDNDPTGEANIALHSTAIDNFLNAGGGIVGLAGASSAGYYNFLPETATSVGGAPFSGYVSTGVDGITAVDNDATHNLFWNPGTMGESSAYQVAEINPTGNGTVPGPAAVTLVCNNCSTAGGVLTSGAVPEPSTFIPLIGGFIGIAFRMRKKVFRG